MLKLEAVVFFIYKKGGYHDFNTVCSNELEFKTASVSINNIKNRKLQDFINRYF